MHTIYAYCTQYMHFTEWYKESIIKNTQDCDNEEQNKHVMKINNIYSISVRLIPEKSVS